MAENLYPALDGLPQLIVALDVYISADEKINGEVDWYRVLDVQPYADEDTIWKHYMAFILHPDKNKFAGAGAFKLLLEAWSLLSDKARRFSYDQKLNLRGGFTNVLHGKSSMAATSSNGFHNSYSDKNSNIGDQHGATYSNSAPPRSTRTDTFWTTCSSCKMQFKYSRPCINLNLPGLKTLFRRHSERSKTWVIPREDLFHFSHQVPSYLVTGREDVPFVDSKRSEEKELVENDQEMKPNTTKEGVRKVVIEEEIKKEKENEKLALLVYIRRQQNKTQQLGKHFDEYKNIESFIVFFSSAYSPIQISKSCQQTG
ncbi:hypothetical protein Gogos_006787 [Gossypium gossypioides]|uniref:J domain-containing protein n=1 Tax=Gossypium gossypioides TaxID=34282 RepID=A0A7J9C6Q4_GOSGO|nr:hypothetical protein [Gossypium gossypioides]